MPTPGRQHAGVPVGALSGPFARAGRRLLLVLGWAQVTVAGLGAVPEGAAGDPASVWRKPLENSIVPVFTSLTTGPAAATLDPTFSNFRLVLEYSAEAAGATVSLAGFTRPLLPGKNQRAEFAVEQTGEGPIIIRTWRTGRPKPDTFERPLPEPRLPPVRFGDFPGHPVAANLAAPAGFTLHRAWVQPLAMADHRAIMEIPEDEALASGASLHTMVCASCHGSSDTAAPHPAARNFGSDAFKAGRDPFSMWQVIRFGHGEMPAQPALTTSQAYAVARFIETSFLRPSGDSTAPATSDPAWLDRLPRGMTTTGEPDPVTPPPWELMDFGPMLFHPIAAGNHPDGSSDLVGKALSIRLDPGPGGLTRGKAWAVYDHETLRLAAWAEGGKLHDNHQLAFDGSPDAHLTLAAARRWQGAEGPGWANPLTGTWDDPRPRSPDGKPVGPLPREWLQFRGLHVHGSSVVLAYRVGDAEILEFPAWDGPGTFTRHFQIGASTRDLALRAGRGDPLAIPAARTPARLSVTIAADGTQSARWNDGPDPAALTRPGPPRFPARLKTTIVRGPDSGPFAMDHLAHPLANAQPGSSWMRFTGFDFLGGDDAAALCTWNGDVWIVEGLEDKDGRLEWRRFASGLAQPMGLKVKGGAIHVGCLDQIVRLEDTDGDGEADVYHCFNSDHQVTGHPREFTRDLKVDDKGNFLYAKGAQPGQDHSPAQHGTLLRVTPDGASTEIIARDLPTPGGIALLPDGSLLVTDQATPDHRQSRILRVAPETATTSLLCRLPEAFDPGPSQPLRIPARYGWGGLDGTTLCLSQGSGRLIGLLPTPAGPSDAVAAWHLPVPPFPTGLLAGRLHGMDLYLCGMDGRTDAHAMDGGFFRMRPTGKEYLRPVAFQANQTTITLTLSQAPDPLKAVDPRSYQLRVRPPGGTPAEDESLVHIERAAIHDRTITLQTDGLTGGYDGTLRIRIHDAKSNFHELNLAFTLPEDLPAPPAEVPPPEAVPDLPGLPDLMPPAPGPDTIRLPELDDPVAPIDPDVEEPLPRKD